MLQFLHKGDEGFERSGLLHITFSHARSKLLRVALLIEPLLRSTGSNPCHSKKRVHISWTLFFLAEGEGFEPSVPLPARQFSRLFPSTTRTPFQNLAEREGFEPSREIAPP